MWSSNSRGHGDRRSTSDQRRSRDYDSRSAPMPAPKASPSLLNVTFKQERDPLKADGWVPLATATAQRARAAEKSDFGECGELHSTRLRSQEQLTALAETEADATKSRDETSFLPSCRPMSIKTLIIGTRVLETRPAQRPLVLSVDSTGLWFDVDTRALDCTGLLATRPIWCFKEASGWENAKKATEKHAMGLFHVPWLSMQRIWATPEAEEAMFFFTLHRLSPISKLIEETYAVANKAYQASANRHGKDGRALITVALDLREGAAGPNIPLRALKWWGRFLTWLDQSYKHASVALTRPADMTLILPDIFNDASVARPSGPPPSMALCIWPLRRAIIGTSAFVPNGNLLPFVEDDPRSMDGLEVKPCRPLRLIRERAKFALAEDRKNAGIEDPGMMMLRVQELSPSQDDAALESGGWVTLLAMADEDVEYAEHAPASEPCSMTLTLVEKSWPVHYMKKLRADSAYRSRSERGGPADLRRVVLDFSAMPLLPPRAHTVCDPKDRFLPGFKPALVNDFDRTRLDRERYEWLCDILKSQVRVDR